MENQSSIDPSRKTVGAIYRDAQMASHDSHVINGDLTHELQKSLADDLNEAIKSLPFGMSSFFITVHEKKDLQMPRAILRRLIKTKYRPYPEDDTIVFWVDPSSNDVRFCWCLPHWSEMDNILMNANLFNHEMVAQIRAWKNLDLYHFGFTKDDMGNWKANPNFSDKRLEKKAVVLS
jgi:hypothetical protein